LANFVAAAEHGLGCAPKTEKDLGNVLAMREVDAITIATPRPLAYADGDTGAAVGQEYAYGGSHLELGAHARDTDGVEYLCRA